MSPGVARRVQVGLVAVSVTVTVAVLGLYVWLIDRQGEGSPAGWFVIGLCAGAGLGVSSLVRTIPGAAVLGFIGGTVLLVMGILGVLSVGLPLLGAGVLMVLAAALQVLTRTGLRR